MFAYYLKSGIRKLRSQLSLTILLTIILALGIAASVTTLTILHALSSDPIPHKSADLLVPVIDNGPLENYIPAAPRSAEDSPHMSYLDASNLLRLKFAKNRTALYNIRSLVESPKAGSGLLSVRGVATTSAYFSMFELPFKYGSAWSEDDDNKGARLIVLSQNTSTQFFGTDNPVGKRLRFQEQDFTIIGVLAAWNPLPRYTNLLNGKSMVAGEDEIYLPFRTAIANKFENSGNLSCSGLVGPGFQGVLDSECLWIQFWFETDSTIQKILLKQQLDAYTADQKKFGRFPRQAPNALFNVREWMEYLHVVPNDSKLATWLSLGFLVLCLVNASGLLLAKFSARTLEIGIRRALGATQAEIFKQYLTESVVLGLAGGTLGLAFTYFCLSRIAMHSADLAVTAQLDFTMLLLTFFLSIAASVAAALLPTWRASKVMPAIQLKSQ
ncbi:MULTISPECIES: ABC transporter permease [unclassified Undibacterium]|uniref:ABC transporter permease n=1 Tax=unclassified Undibacterium TaxID=2630295 RepID=UPI002AC9CBC5|nr:MULTISPECIES: ABC transporter permease [unclassified Undibacterium]MEB0138168.1 ABC transporter permease [Undibacterium sp. CCC2.1]MEB0171077.1 ABC transporter permease [Undibacterium sp. CCC1.1]MEB0175122.1 ABC transporter permease [Undibacterium sp. CCC3.4]MEB0214294.1 ABC transporter permease [Undibacterium sp. 5I2]WPX41874.1 ABC transporter permease [Undibacterium sp. CCC3.4]